MFYTPLYGSCSRKTAGRTVKPGIKVKRPTVAMGKSTPMVASNLPKRNSAMRQPNGRPWKKMGL